MALITIQGSASNCGAQLAAVTSSTVFINGEKVGIKGDMVGNETGVPHDLKSGVTTTVTNVNIDGSAPIVEGDSVADHTVPIPNGRAPHNFKKMQVNGSRNSTVFTGRST